MIEILKESLAQCEALYKLSQDEATQLNLVKEITKLKLHIYELSKAME